tara:strand:+ start:1651 stop:1875 length:225 start_codon:yes stop_codon:yes gene_type:complete
MEKYMITDKKGKVVSVHKDLQKIIMVSDAMQSHYRREVFRTSKYNGSMDFSDKSLEASNIFMEINEAITDNETI